MKTINKKPEVIEYEFDINGLTKNEMRLLARGLFLVRREIIDYLCDNPNNLRAEADQSEAFDLMKAIEGRINYEYKRCECRTETV